MRSSHTSPHILAALSLTVILTLFTSACGSTTDRMAAARPTEAPATGGTTAITRPTQASATGGIVNAAATIVRPTPPPAATVVPTAPPTATPEPLRALVVKASGFGQKGKSFGYGVVVENPNRAASLEGAALQLVAYDEAGTMLGTEDSTIPLIPPGATIHFGGSTFIDTDSPVSRVEVQVTDEGTAQAATPEQIPPFSVNAISFRENAIGQHVSGIVSNPFVAPLTNLYVGVVVYDSAEKIIGGGFTFLDFLLPEGKSPFVTSVTVNGTPARIEVSPILSTLTLWGQRDKEKMPPLTMIEQGGSLNGSQIGYGIIVENPHTTQALTGSKYTIAAYANDGTVLSVESGYFGLILPGSKAVRAGTLYIDSDGVSPDRVEAIIFPGSLENAEGKLAFSIEGATFVTGSYTSKTTGQIVNPYDKKVKNVQVNAILRDATGKIIGGGAAYSDTIPAKGKAAIEISVAVSGEVATTELYANEAGITSIGDK
ncbi:MAG: FxLYD domain-containing protein [Chloroflexales bacterium]